MNIPQTSASHDPRSAPLTEFRHFLANEASSAVLFIIEFISGFGRIYPCRFDRCRACSALARARISRMRDQTAGRHTD